MFVVKRDKHNPIIKPNEKNYWESHATFNWCPIRIGDTTHVYYRAQSHHDLLYGPNLSLSTIGYAQSKDGIHFEYNQQIIVPEEEWEQYGCEDPRATRIDDKTFIFYTALSKFPFSYDGIKVACAISSVGTKIDEKHLITPFNAKAMTLFPEKINGKYVALLTVHPDMPPSSICVAEFDSIEQMWDMSYWQQWYASYKEHEVYLLRGVGDHVEIGAPPIKTEKGWLLIYSHIYSYMSDKKKFGVEAVILDFNDPQKIVSRTNYPFLVPELYYEKEGDVENIVFPSGALKIDNKLQIFYGGADTVCCLAEVSYTDFIDSFEGSSYKESVVRYEKNPVIVPDKNNKWESVSIFNPAAIDIDGTIHILYRAMGDDNTSVIGYASTKDGFNLTEKLDHPIYVPRENFELKLKPPTGYSGCEDPRITRIDDKLYMLYTAYDGVNPPRVAATSIFVTEFLRKDWKWSAAKLITPSSVDDKDACIFKNKADNRIIAIHRVSSHVCLDYLDSLDFELSKIDKCIPLLAPRPGMWDSAKIGISSPPMETEAGWLLLYHGVSDDSIYRVGAALLEYHNPANVVARTADYIFEPKMDYEKIGIVTNVVFPCGSVIRDDKVFIYYGGGDRVLGIATLDLKKTLEALLV